MIAVYFIFLGLFAVLLFISAAQHKKYEEVEQESKLLTVIIPFRNEEANLPGLIKSIQAQAVLPHEILFIDDHSSDNGTKLLESEFLGIPDISIISLPNALGGKKEAIDFGVKRATCDYCLTLDADVEFDKMFFRCILKNLNADMMIGSVIMKSDSFLSRLFSFEYMLFNAFNFSFSSFFVNSASGANLLFSREKYISVNSLTRHSAIASGDDYFLLRDFQHHSASIVLNNQLDIAVYTKSASGWSDYFNQRIRWLSKTRTALNSKELVVGLVLIVYLIGSFVLSTYLLYQKNFVLLFVLLGVRFLIDLFVYSNYAARLGALKLFLIYPVFFILYPFMFCAIAAGTFLYRPKWKGRPLIKKE
jgi:glycosyltransferase involved in cell wall biosynthesis